MNLIEAIKSGRNFKRPYMKDYCKNRSETYSTHQFYSSDFIAEDWELEPEKEEYVLGSIFRVVKEGSFRWIDFNNLEEVNQFILDNEGEFCVREIIKRVKK